MTRGLIAVVLVRADALLQARSVDFAIWEAQRLQSACAKALADGRPRDPKTGERA